MRKAFLYDTSFILVTVIAQSTFGPNLLQNSYFTQPALPSNYLMGLYNLEIPGWHCSIQCEIDNCKKANAMFTFGNCYNQILDLNSQNIETVSQLFAVVSDDRHLLNFTFLYPVYQAAQKTLLIRLNGELVFSFCPISMDYLNHSQSIYI